MAINGQFPPTNTNARLKAQLNNTIEQVNQLHQRVENIFKTLQEASSVPNRSTAESASSLSEGYEMPSQKIGALDQKQKEILRRLEKIESIIGRLAPNE